MKSLQINKEKKIIQIRFNSSFYSAQTLLNSMKDFNSLCSTSLKPQDSDFIVELRFSSDMKDEDMITIGHEFCNYTLGSMKNKMEV